MRRRLSEPFLKPPRGRGGLEKQVITRLKGPGVESQPRPFENWGVTMYKTRRGADQNQSPKLDPPQNPIYRGLRMRIGLGVILLAVTTVLGAPVLLRAEPGEGSLPSTVILSVSPRTVRWAAVHTRPARSDRDPYYHVEVIEKERRTPPWQFKRLAVHLVVTADALERSHLRQNAKTYFYKDIEFRIAYQGWRGQPLTQREAVVCRTTILECVGAGDDTRR